jgi:hypothetical protein
MYAEQNTDYKSNSRTSKLKMNKPNPDKDILAAAGLDDNQLE